MDGDMDITDERLGQLVAVLAKKDRDTTHYEGCEENHPRCLVYRLWARIEELKRESRRAAVDLR